MFEKIPDIIKEASRKLRKNMTKSEEILWDKLRAKRFLWKKFLRQSPIYVFTENSWLDRFVIPDFVYFQDKLIIELDWSIHNLKEIYELDQEKERLLKNKWFNIIRFKNEEVFWDIEGVLEKIKIEINES